VQSETALPQGSSILDKAFRQDKVKEHLMQLSTYELKYCERCGSLRLRRSASAETYCEPCAQMLANYSLRNHVGRASLRLHKPRAKSVTAPILHADTPQLPLGRLQ
jgi:hypothetical protein